jgi:hypothetical protein
MKTANRLLRLHRETLAHLDTRVLSRVQGGAYLTQFDCPADDAGPSRDPEPLSAGPSWCGC